MRVEIDYRKPDTFTKSPRCYIRLFPETVDEVGKMDTVLPMFMKACEIEKVLTWEQTHYIITLHAPEVVTNG